MYAKLVSLVGTGKDFMLCMPSQLVWLVQVRTSCYVCQAGQPGWYR